jgi:hypothetical protein
MTVTGDADQARAAEPLRLVPALSAAGRLARAEGFVDPGLGHELRLPGIGGRYLAGLADHAGSGGWEPAEISALLGAVEERSALWVVSPSAAALRRAGLISRGRGRRACARWSAGRWTRAAADPAALAALAAADRSGVVCASAVSGRGAPARLVAAVSAPGVRSGHLDAGLAAVLGVPWTVELLLAPALPPGSLMALRERLAAAPRCGWCGVPMPSGRCRRCQPSVLQ